MSMASLVCILLRYALTAVGLPVGVGCWEQHLSCSSVCCQPLKWFLVKQGKRGRCLLDDERVCLSVRQRACVFVCQVDKRSDMSWNS